MTIMHCGVISIIRDVRLCGFGLLFKDEINHSALWYWLVEGRNSGQETKVMLLIFWPCKGCLNHLIGDRAIDVIMFYGLWIARSFFFLLLAVCKVLHKKMISMEVLWFRRHYHGNFSPTSSLQLQCIVTILFNYLFLNIKKNIINIAQKFIYTRN